MHAFLVLHQLLLITSQPSAPLSCTGVVDGLDGDAQGPLSASSFGTWQQYAAFERTLLDSFLSTGITRYAMQCALSHSLSLSHSLALSPCSEQW